MVLISNIAQRLLDENNITTDDITVVKFEYLIDNAVDHINLVAGTSIANISSNDLTATASEFAAIKTLSGLLLRAYMDKGPQTAIGGMGVTEITSDPHYRVFMKLFNQSLQYLRGRSFTRT